MTYLAKVCVMLRAYWTGDRFKFR